MLRDEKALRNFAPKRCFVFGNRLNCVYLLKKEDKAACLLIKQHAMEAYGGVEI